MESASIMRGEVWVQDDKIIYVGDGRDMQSVFRRLGVPYIDWDREIDCEWNLLMPGFKNAHTHSTTLRMHPNAKALNYYLTQYSILEYLRSGITAICDMHMAPAMIVDACVDMGMRCVQVGSVNNFSHPVSEMEQMLEELNNRDPLISYLIGFHAEYSCSKDLLQQVAVLSHKYKAPVYAQIAKTEREVQECVKRYGMTPVLFLQSLGLFEYGGGGFHCTYMSDWDMEVFVKRGLNIVANPGTDMKLAKRLAPLAQYMAKGINVALGTDGPCTNDCLDMFQEMFLISTFTNMREYHFDTANGWEILKMATVNGSKAMCLPDSDVLAAGKQADLIMINLQQQNLRYSENLISDLVLRGKRQNVKMTMIAGQILYENGEFADFIDVEGIFAKIRELHRLPMKMRSGHAGL
jgi:5-methylthioadenosine/S-adenosylhomocysteine deaminase